MFHFQRQFILYNFKLLVKSTILSNKITERTMPKRNNGGAESGHKMRKQGQETSSVGGQFEGQTQELCRPPTEQRSHSKGIDER